MQSVAIDYLCNLIRHDQRFLRLVMLLEDAYPGGWPLNRARLAAGIPILLVLELHVAARRLGLGSLPTPGLLLIHVLVGRKSPDIDERLLEKVEWFYDHFSRSRSLVQIGHDAGFSESTVTQAVTRVRRLLGVRPRRGRPPRWHYGSTHLRFSL